MTEGPISHLLNKSVDVYRLGRTVVNGAFVEAYTLVYSNVPCRISSPSVAELMQAQQTGATVDYVGYFEADADIRRRDELRGITEFGTLTVINPARPSVTDHHLKVQLNSLPPAEG